MCGIAGFWDIAHRFGEEEAATALRSMAAPIRHRGPDDEGYFWDGPAGLGLGFRRLSIVDLSQDGHQPMTSASGRFIIVFNGEVYNHARLRPDLEEAGFAFRGHSDTEVVLAAIEHWGLEAAVQRFIGMFAFAVWDRKQRTLTLARDRLGIKPLYFGWVGPLFAFASEYKAIAALPGFACAVDRNALALYLRHGYVPAPYCMVKGLRKLMPGTLLTVDAPLVSRKLDGTALEAHAVTYWSAREVVELGAAGRSTLTDGDATEALDRLLRDAVALRMQADVPLGAFLSGGVDSSTVVALMQAQSVRPVKTFSIGFREDAYDEARHAQAVAGHLGTDHHELYVTANTAQDVIPLLPSMYDEPFADVSQIPTFLVSKLAREHVTVSLSGDGGDELFTGYNHYFWGGKLERVIGRMPGPLRRGVAGALRSQGAFFEAAFERGNRFLPPRFRPRNPRSKIGILAEMLGARSGDERYRFLLSHWPDAAAIVPGSREPMTALTDPARHARLDDPVERMMYFDLVGYLPDDILTKVDRASMAASLEARVPLLDHRVVEFAWRVPPEQRVRDGQGKWLLRQVLYRYVPKDLIERPKKGFDVPIGSWLRGPLRDWAEALLNEQRLREEGYFDSALIRAIWEGHVAGRLNEHYRLWDVLMFQAWLDVQKKNDDFRIASCESIAHSASALS